VQIIIEISYFEVSTLHKLVFNITPPTNQPTNRVLEKLTIVQLVKKCPAFYETNWFITVFTGPYPKLDESSLHSPTLFLQDPLQYYSFQVHLVLPSGAFPAGIPTKILYALL
jgi:hypothetical protein